MSPPNNKERKDKINKSQNIIHMISSVKRNMVNKLKKLLSKIVKIEQKDLILLRVALHFTKNKDQKLLPNSLLQENAK
jgi:hypothetical protein